MSSIHVASMILLLFLFLHHSDSRHLDNVHITASRFSLVKVLDPHFNSSTFHLLSCSSYLRYLFITFSKLRLLFVFLWLRIKMLSLVRHLKNPLKFLGLCRVHWSTTIVVHRSYLQIIRSRPLGLHAITETSLFSFFFLSSYLVFLYVRESTYVLNSFLNMFPNVEFFWSIGSCFHF